MSFGNDSHFSVLFLSISASMRPPFIMGSRVQHEFLWLAINNVFLHFPCADQKGDIYNEGCQTSICRPSTRGKSCYFETLGFMGTFAWLLSFSNVRLVMLGYSKPDKDLYYLGIYYRRWIVWQNSKPFNHVTCCEHSNSFLNAHWCWASHVGSSWSA